jgi:Amt family ammonium transporter
MSAGWAALAGAMFLGKRKTQKSNPARITYVLLGTGLLWFGWFGFNAGSALEQVALQYKHSGQLSLLLLLVWLGYFR